MEGVFPAIPVDYMALLDTSDLKRGWRIGRLDERGEACGGAAKPDACEASMAE